MKLRTLGRSGLSVSPLCFGGNVFGWTADEKTSFALLDAFVGAGGNFIDTADVYSRWAPGHTGGESETILGKWLKQPGKRRQVILATKVGMDMGNDQVGLKPAYIAKAIDASLKRLQIDHVDLYQAHVDDAGTPLTDTLDAFDRLIKAGKVRAIGASNYSAARLAEALQISQREGLARYESLQPHYNLVERDGFERELQPLCVKESVGVINYFALAAGFLTGKYRSAEDLNKSVRGPSMVKNHLNPRGMRILDALDRIAKQTGQAPASIALAWQMAQPAITAPIASATSVAQLSALVAAASIELDRTALDALSAASAPEAKP